MQWQPRGGVIDSAATSIESHIFGLGGWLDLKLMGSLVCSNLSFVIPEIVQRLAGIGEPQDMRSLTDPGSTLRLAGMTIEREWRG